MSTDDGKLMVFGTPPNLKMGRECDVLHSHIGAIKQLQKTIDNRILITSGDDGTLFVYRVSDGSNNKIGKFTNKVTERYEELERASRAVRIQREADFNNSKNISID